MQRRGQKAVVHNVGEMKGLPATYSGEEEEGEVALDCDQVKPVSSQKRPTNRPHSAN